MGSRKGMRAQEQQAREDGELSGAGAGFREAHSHSPDSAGRRSIETPPSQTMEDDTRSAIGSDDSDESDDIGRFNDSRFDNSDDAADEENDLA